MNYLITAPDGAKHVGDSNLRDYYPHVNNNLAWATVKRAIHTTTRDRIVPAVGAAYYEALTDAQTPTPAQERVIDLLRDALVHYVVWEVSQHHQVTIGDFGVVQTSSKDGTASPLQEWRYRNFHWKMLVSADQYLDRALALLCEHPADYPEFDQSVAMADGLIVRHTKQFERYQHIANSRRTFLALVPGMRQVMRTVLLPLLGERLHGRLVHAPQNDALNVAEQAVRELAGELLVFRTIEDNILSLAVQMEGGGFYTVTSNDAMTTKQSAHKEFVIAFQRKMQQNANHAHNRLRETLVRYQDDLGDWNETAGKYLVAGQHTTKPYTFGNGGVFL